MLDWIDYIVLYWVGLNCIKLCYILLRCIVLYCGVLYYIVLDEIY